MRVARSFLVGIMLATALQPDAWAAKSDAEVAAAILRDVLATKDAKAVAEARQGCVGGTQAEATAFTRANGLGGFPDASDYCLAVLIRTARDGGLLDVYEKIVAKHGGDPANVTTLPDAVGGALLKQKAKDVPIGNGLAVGIKPALAFDAGFVTAYRTNDSDMAGLPGAADLKNSAEACLAQRASDMAPCFWTGYALGARALNGLVPPIADR